MLHKILPALGFLLILCCHAQANPGSEPAKNLKPPMAAKMDWQELRHGEVVKDEYYWLRDKEKPEVRAHLEAENAYTQSMSAHLQPLSEKIFQEIKGRLQATDLSVPLKKGRHYYYSRFEAGKQYPIYCRRQADALGNDDPSAAEEVLLDQNQLAQGQTYLAVAYQSISPDGRYLAYATDHSGAREFSLHIKDLHTGKVHAGLAERISSLAWAGNQATLFFVQKDASSKRPSRLYRLSLGEKPVLVQEEKDEQFGLDVALSHDQQFILLSAEASDTREMWLLSARQPEQALRPTLGRSKGHRYELEHRAGQLLILTNHNAKNFKLVSAPLATPEPKHWRELIAHDDQVLLNNQDVFQDYLVVTEKSQALSRLRIYSFTKQSWQTIKFDDQVYSARNLFATEFGSDKMRISYQSPITPPTVFEVDMNTGKQRVLKQVLAGFDSSRYEVKRLWATAPDGVKVPLFAAYKKDMKRDGKAPLLLYGYGSHGQSSEPFFSYARLSLLERGVVYVQAQVRGGNDLGEVWHEDGMLMKKKNTFTDFIACAEHLIAEKWTSKERLIIQGASAGGLLIGAVVNMRPDLFKAVQADVPFVDVMNTLMDKSLPLTTAEYLEWGDPHQKAVYDYIRSYAPYDNIGKQAYPAMLVTASLNDSQVMYWEAVKYVARLRANKTGDHPLLLKINMHAGHGGASGRFDAFRETAFVFAWMLEQWGLQK